MHVCILYISQRKDIHNLGFQLYAHPLLCNTLPKQNEIFCLVNLLLTGGFFGSAGFLTLQPQTEWWELPTRVNR